MWHSVNRGGSGYREERVIRLPKLTTVQSKAMSKQPRTSTRGGGASALQEAPTAGSPTPSMPPFHFLLSITPSAAGSGPAPTSVQAEERRRGAGSPPAAAGEVHVLRLPTTMSCSGLGALAPNRSRGRCDGAQLNSTHHLRAVFKESDK